MHEKINLLLWKDMVLIYRKPMELLLQLLVSVSFLLPLILITKNHQHNQKVYDQVCTVPSLCPNENFTLPYTNIIYSPNKNTKIHKVMEYVRDLTKLNVISSSSANLVDHFKKPGSYETLAGIQFSDSLDGEQDLPKTVEVSIRFPSRLRLDVDWNWKTNLKFPPTYTPGPRNYTLPYGGPPRYYEEGFLLLQSAVGYALLMVQEEIDDVKSDAKDLIKKMKLPILKISRFPNGIWVENENFQLLALGGALLVYSFLVACTNIIKAIDTEKENQLTEIMKIMGLRSSFQWLAWFILNFAIFMMSILVIVICGKLPTDEYNVSQIFPHSNMLIVFLFLILYACSAIAFSFAISVFCSTAFIGTTVGSIVIFASIFPFLYICGHYYSINFFWKLVASLMHNTAMAFGFRIIVMYESVGMGNEIWMKIFHKSNTKLLGITWDNLWKPYSPDDNLSVGLMIIMLIIDTIIYVFVTICMEYARTSFLHDLLSKFKSQTSQEVSPNMLDEETSTTDLEINAFETEPTDLPVGIQLINLRKTYGNHVSVKDVSLNMYRGQITVLLGHNGAGKTSLMSMLTGIIPITSGTAIINGYDIKTELHTIRQDLGLCPQHNILFNDMTVEEHLYFYSKLKGLNEYEIAYHVLKYIRLLELEAKARSPAKTLAGGMKRKLNIGIALCGGSSVVLLDEPTAGVDAKARRAVWRLLQKERKNRTILLSTHYMDEADLLGDRIAIMADGKIKCCGSSFFLKNRYGLGYKLIMEKNVFCNEENVTALLQKYLPNVKIRSNIGSELTYILPKEEVKNFPFILYNLENESQNLGVTSFGISSPNLEEVFMRLGSDLSYRNMNFVSADRKPFSLNTVQTPSQYLIEKALLLNQFKAMCLKRFISIIRCKEVFLVSVLGPIAIWCVMLFRKSIQVNYNLPKLELSLRDYEDLYTAIDGTKTIYYNAYVKLLEKYGSKVLQVDDISSLMIYLSQTTPGFYSHYMIGATFEEENIIGWFSNSPYHAAGISVDSIISSLYQAKFGEDHDIIFYNYPLPYFHANEIEIGVDSTNILLQYINTLVQLSINLIFTTSSLLLFYIKERVCKSKHLQYVSGVRVYIFWLSSFICDFAYYLLIMVISVMVLLTLQEEGSNTPEDLGRIVMIFFFFGISVLPFNYIFSQFFNTPVDGFANMNIISIIIISFWATIHTKHTLHHILLNLPHYAFIDAIFKSIHTSKDLYDCTNLAEICQIIENKTLDQCWNGLCEKITKCCNRYPNYYEWKDNGIGKNLVNCAIIGIVFFLLLVFYEYGYFDTVYKYLTSRGNINARLKIRGEEDEDVLAEKNFIRTTPIEKLTDDNILTVKDLTKIYKRYVAVNRLCFCVKEFECFGLLGINGAGKTSTFEMLSGGTPITLGDAWITKYSIKTEINEAQKLIGYCPQFNALLETLTVSETLTIYCLLRGIPSENCGNVIKELSTKFDFQKHIHKQINHLSGGNKRKVSTAIALIREPPVIYLDEPSAGLDPATQRFLWNAVSNYRYMGKSIVLTSHSMDECEALCTRLAIMVDGNFKCIGSLQHLKSRYAQGYSLTVKLKERTHRTRKRLKKFIKKTFPNTRTKESNGELYTFLLPLDRTWSEVFGVLEYYKDEYSIEDYTLSQTSLEQIFLAFARQETPKFELKALQRVQFDLDL